MFGPQAYNNIIAGRGKSQTDSGVFSPFFPRIASDPQRWIYILEGSGSPSPWTGHKNSQPQRL